MREAGAVCILCISQSSWTLVKWSDWHSAIGWVFANGQLYNGWKYNIYSAPSHFVLKQPRFTAALVDFWSGGHQPSSWSITRSIHSTIVVLYYQISAPTGLDIDFTLEVLSTSEVNAEWRSEKRLIGLRYRTGWQHAWPESQTTRGHRGCHLLPFPTIVDYRVSIWCSYDAMTWWWWPSRKSPVGRQSGTFRLLHSLNRAWSLWRAKLSSSPSPSLVNNNCD